MKPTFLRLSILVLSIGLGVTVSVLLSGHNASNPSIPPIETTPAIETISYPPIRSVVITVPAEDEFYIGKQQLHLSQIREVVERTLISIPIDERIVYLKPAVGIRAETLALVIKEAKLAGVERIELVVDKKKVALTL